MTLAKRTLKVGNGEDCGSLRTRFKSALVTGQVTFGLREYGAAILSSR
jgi:hypothetical protein